MTKRLTGKRKAVKPIPVAAKRRRPRLGKKRPETVAGTSAQPWGQNGVQGLSQEKEFKAYIELQEKINRGLRAFIDEMTIVFRFIETVSELHSQERILGLLLEVVKDLCPYEAAAVFLEERSEPQDIRGQRLMLASNPGLVESFQRQLQIDETIYQWLFRRGHPIVIPGRFQAQPERPEQPGSFMLVPLRTTTEKIGRLELVFNRPAGEFTQQTFSILGVLMKHAALIIANERVYEKERRTARKYIELDKLKQDIVNTTTHEIKTPLTIINASALMLRRNAAMPQTEREGMLDSVIRQCNRIDRIISQLVETSLLEENQVVLQRKPVCLRTLTAELLKDLAYHGQNQAFQVQMPRKLWKVSADRDSIYKVMRNLIENAIKYSPQGSQIQISGQNQDDQVVWQIKDQGVGIPEDEQVKIFEKFYRIGDSTTRDVQGMGFGLYIVKKNIELNGGTVSVKSKVGEGSTFTLVLPKAKNTPQSAAQEKYGSRPAAR